MSAAADLRERARVAGEEEEGANRDRTRESYERTLSRGFPPPRSELCTGTVRRQSNTTQEAVAVSSHFAAVAKWKVRSRVDAGPTVAASQTEHAAAMQSRSTQLAPLLRAVAVVTLSCYGGRKRARQPS